MTRYRTVDAQGRTTATVVLADPRAALAWAATEHPGTRLQRWVDVAPVGYWSTVFAPRTAAGVPPPREGGRPRPARVAPDPETPASLEG